MDQTIKKIPIMAIELPDLLISDQFSLWASNQESRGNEGNYLLLEPKTELYTQKKNPLEQTETLQEKKDLTKIERHEKILLLWSKDTVLL